MGLKSIRSIIIKKLREGRIQHELNRSGYICEKNFLVTGKITVDEVIELLNAVKGSGYNTSRHHYDKSIEIHIFKTRKNQIDWYIKCYVIEPDVWFISVHQ